MSFWFWQIFFKFVRFLHRSDNVWLFDNGNVMIVVSISCLLLLRLSIHTHTNTRASACVRMQTRSHQHGIVCVRECFGDIPSMRTSIKNNFHVSVCFFFCFSSLPSETRIFNRMFLLRSHFPFNVCGTYVNAILTHFHRIYEWILCFCWFSFIFSAALFYFVCYRDVGNKCQFWSPS